MILILSNKWDLSVDFVVRELRKRGHFFLRLNAEDLPSGRATIQLPDWQILASKRGEDIDLSANVRVIWNRRPGKPFDDIPKDQRPSQATQRFINDQWYSWLEGLQMLDATWINQPQRNDSMESKVRQLCVASRLGFDIPRSLVSNDPTRIRDFIQSCGGNAIGKALYSPLIEEPERDWFIFTTDLGEIDTKFDEQLRSTPTIFQERIAPKVDYRVTVVGKKVFAVRIEAGGDASVELDWRTQKEGLSFVSCRLPRKIEILCQKFLKEAGLVFGAIDLVEHNGKFTFLEINPSGEWGWLQKPVGLPIAEALVDLMIQYDTEKEKL